MMAQNMLEYSKEILQKVSFDRELFKKELEKAMRLLSEDEVRELMVWCRMQFGMEMLAV
ncbi:MAG: hypothetical protein KatS3mg031_1638 [Chitinophagales bacterium]|nr:MAG: hypothetical protein KatS3mg031_1638 [Chitinophagales bacterium]